MITQESYMPYVSIVVPVYNGARVIKLCLDALQKLDYPPELFEVFVVDNNSNDGTPDIVSNYPVNLVYEREIQSSYAARNLGIRQSSGEILAFIDADCIPDENWLKELVKPFINRTMVGVAGKIATYQPNSLIEEFTDSIDPLGKKRLGGMLSMVTANVAYRRSILMEVNGFKSEMYTGADVDLGWRIQQLMDYQVTYTRNAIVYHKHRSTITGLFRQYFRYGFSEIMLDTLYRNQTFYPRSPQNQLILMLHQLRALVTYSFSFVYRLVRSLLFGWNTNYHVWPLLWFVVESSSLLGKIRGLIWTRFFTRKP